MKDKDKPQGLANDAPWSNSRASVSTTEGLSANLSGAAKWCGGCRTHYARSEFHKSRCASDGLSSRCKDCAKATTRKWYAGNKERASAKSKERGREWYARNKDQAAARRKAYAAENAEHVAALRKVRDARNRTTPAFRLRARVSTAVRRALQGNKPGASFVLVGYSVADLAQHLERQFLPGMSWENMDQWHIDHIVPLAEFKASSPDSPAFKAAWALSNLRPLWAKDNMKKGARRESLL